MPRVDDPSLDGLLPGGASLLDALWVPECREQFHPNRRRLRRPQPAPIARRVTTRLLLQQLLSAMELLEPDAILGRVVRKLATGAVDARAGLLAGGGF